MDKDRTTMGKPKRLAKPNIFKNEAEIEYIDETAMPGYQFNEFANRKERRKMKLRVPIKQELNKQTYKKDDEAIRKLKFKDRNK